MDVSDKSVIFTLKYIVVFIEFPWLARPEVGRGEREREREESLPTTGRSSSKELKLCVKEEFEGTIIAHCFSSWGKHHGHLFPTRSFL